MNWDALPELLKVIGVVVGFSVIGGLVVRWSEPKPYERRDR